MFPLKNLKTFMNTPEEWHSFTLGFFFCTVRKVRKSPELHYVLGELHYYYFGRFLGIIFWIGMTLVAIEVSKCVL